MMWLQKGNTATLKNYGSILKREEISKRIIEICKDVVQKDSYKNAVIAAGKIRALAMACEYDTYWNEKMCHGFEEELCRAEQVIYKNNKEKGEGDK